MLKCKNYSNNKMKTESSDSQISQTRILFTIEHKKKKQIKCLSKGILLFHGNDEVILNLMAAVCLKKLGAESAKSWKHECFKKSRSNILQLFKLIINRSVT